MAEYGDMEFLLSILAGGACLALPLLLVAALIRFGELDRLARRVAELERRIGAATRDEGHARGAEPIPAERVEPEPAEAPARQTASEVARAVARSHREPEPELAARTHPEPPSPPRPELERWLGVRAAALLGGLLFALAGILFFKHALDQGWVTPGRRVALGISVGIAAVVASELLWRRAFGITANALGGAGFVVLYASLWSGHALYDLFGLAVSAVGLLGTTIGICAMALRQRSQVLAILGLAGGAAAPFLLSFAFERPLAFFGYLFALDAAVLAMARERRWPWLAVASFAVSGALQLAWVAFVMPPAELLLALFVAGSFSLLFALGAERAAQDEGHAKPIWRTVQALAIGLPFALVLPLELGAAAPASFEPFALLLGVVNLGALFLGRAWPRSPLAWIASAGTSFVLCVWSRQFELSGPSWSFVLSGIALVALPLLASEVERLRGVSGARVAACVSAGGLFLALLLASARLGARELVAYGTGALAAAAFLFRLGSSGRDALARSAPGLGACGLGLALLLAGQGRLEGAGTIFVALLLGSALAACGLAAWREVRGPEASREGTWRGAVVLAIANLLALALAVAARDLGETAVLASAAALILHTSVAIGFLRRGPWLAGAALAGALALLSGGPSSGSWLSFVLVLTAFLVLVLPVVSRAERYASPGSWIGLGLAPIAFLFPLLKQFVGAFGEGLDGVPVAGLAVVTVGLRFLARGERGARVALGVAACVLVALALPFQVEEHGLVVFLSVAAAGIAFVWRREGSHWLAWVSFGLAAASIVLLVGRSLWFGTFERTDAVVFNLVSYASGVPAVALGGAAWLLRTAPGPRRDEVSPSSLVALFAVVALFAWGNLLLCNAHSPGDLVEFAFRRIPTRDLWMSLYWTAFALGLLGAGMASGRRGLRWLSLVLLLATLGKVFLYDLGQLEGLYRVASLSGLGLSLLLVSALYQRVVFRTGGTAKWHAREDSNLRPPD